MSTVRIMNTYILGAILSVLPIMSLLAAGSVGTPVSAVYLSRHAQSVDDLNRKFTYANYTDIEVAIVNALDTTAIYNSLEKITPGSSTLSADVDAAVAVWKNFIDKHKEKLSQNPEASNAFATLAAQIPYLHEVSKFAKGNFLNAKNPNKAMDFNEATQAMVALVNLKKYVPKMAASIEEAGKEFTRLYNMTIEEPSAPPLENPGLDAAVKELNELRQIVNAAATYQTGWISNKSYEVKRAGYWQRMVDLAANNSLDQDQRADLSKLQGTFAARSWKIGDKQAAKWIDFPNIDYSDYFKQVLGQADPYVSPLAQFGDRMTEINTFWKELKGDAKKANVELAFLQYGLKNLIEIVNGNLPTDFNEKLAKAVSAYAVREYLDTKGQQQFDFSLKKLANKLTKENIQIFINKVEELSNKNDMPMLKRYRDFATMLYQEYLGKKNQTEEQKNTLASLKTAKDKLDNLLGAGESNV